MSNIPKEFIDSINDKSRYENFSEEVQIINETTAGKMTLYTVTNKNGVTFQKVPGQPGLEDRGFMGFVQGDRARPIMLSGSVRTTVTETDDNTVTGGFDPLVDINPSIMWDIQLTADAGALGDDTATGSYFITVS